MKQIAVEIWSGKRSINKPDHSFMLYFINLGNSNIAQAQTNAAASQMKQKKKVRPIL